MFVMFYPDFRDKPLNSDGINYKHKQSKYVDICIICKMYKLYKL